MALVIGFCLAAWFTTQPAVRVVGKVVDDSGRPIRTAQVRVRGSRSLGTAPVEADGRFNLSLGGTEDVVSLDVTAGGYEKRSRKVPVTNGVADAGTLTMKAAKGLSLSSLTVTLSGDGKENHIDVFVANAGDKRAEIVSLRLQARRRPETECLDATPGILFSIHDQLLAGHVAASMTAAAGGGGTPDSVQATGQFITLGCGQRHIDLTLPYSISMEPGEHTKLRVAIPSSLKTSDKASPVQARLDEFAVVSLTLHPASGSDVSIRRDGKDPENAP